jgi:three-Cys-motif partner protein
MAKNNIDAKETMLEHSKAKVELYSKYLEKYLNIISNDKYTERINIYDLFCGKGTYKNGGYGSPIAAIKIINKFLALNTMSKIQIKLFFNDIEKSKIAALENSVNSLGIAQNCEV